MGRFLFSMLFFSMFWGLSLLSCESESEGGGNSEAWGYKSKNLVTGYLIPEKMRVSQVMSDSSDAILDVEINGFVASRALVEFERSEYTLSANHLLKENDFEKSIAVFDSMSVVYKDTAFNKMIPMSGYWALALPVDAISVVSDMNYDDAHPAGSDLSDFVRISTSSYGNSVLNEYAVPYSSYIEKKLSELTRQDRTLLSASVEMDGTNYRDGYSHVGRILIPKTDSPKKCHVTVTYLFANGQKLSSIVQMEI